jgi:hypothetical protein
MPSDNFFSESRNRVRAANAASRDSIRWWLLVEAADIRRHPLEHERGACAGRLTAPRGKFVEEFLMAVDGARGTSRPKLMLENNGRTQVGYRIAQLIFGTGGLIAKKAI